MEENIYKRYREIKDQLAELEKQKTEIELQLLDDLDMYGGKRETTFGFFSSEGRRVWEYSDNIGALAKELAKKKKIEELDGTATLKKVTSYVKLVIPKEKE